MRKMVRHIKLKIKDHNEDEAYEVYPLNISKDIFASFIMYDDEGLIPHCHIRIWRKDGEKREYLYHIALRLDKPKFFHIKELGILDNKKYLGEIIKLLENRLDSLSYESSLWEFLFDSWNFTLRNRKVNPRRMKIPNYRKMI